MTPTNDWITDRRPTEADGDRDGLVIARCGLDNHVLTYLHWSHPYWNLVSRARLLWRHTDTWQPPATPEPEPTKPALAVGQRWRRRDGEVVTVGLDSNGLLKAGYWCYQSDGIAPGAGSHTDLIELLTPTPTPRKFASLTRTVTDFGHTIDAIDEDGVAWWMTLAMDDSEPEWHQLTPLPGREVVG